MAMLAMAIQVRVWVVCCAIVPHLAHARLVRWGLWLLHGACYVPEPRINPHMTMAMALA